MEELEYHKSEEFPEEIQDVDPLEFVPTSFAFDEERTNTVGGVNYVFSDENDNVIRLSLKERDLFTASFYVNNKEKGLSRSFSPIKDKQELRDKSTTLIEDILDIEMQ